MRWYLRSPALVGSLSVLALVAGWLWASHAPLPSPEETEASPVYVAFLGGMLVERMLMDCYKDDWLIFSYDTQENIRLNMRLRARAFRLASAQYTCSELRTLEAAIRPQAYFPATGRSGRIIIPVQGPQIAIDAERMAWPTQVVLVLPSTAPLVMANPVGQAREGQSLTVAILDTHGQAIQFGTAYQGTPAYPLPAMTGPAPACWHFLWHAQAWKLVQVTTNEERPCEKHGAHQAH